MSSPAAHQSGDINRLRNQIGRVRPFLRHGRFVLTSDRLADGETDVPTIDTSGGVDQHDVRFLEHCHAIKSDGTAYIVSSNGKERPRTVWQWREETRQRLLDFDDERTVLPRCDHRPHINNPEWADELACKECGEEYTKDEVRALL